MSFKGKITTTANQLIKLTLVKPELKMVKPEYLLERPW